MTDTTEVKPESHAFEADVAKLLQLMVHSVYSDKEIFLRELISNAADACERLRYEAIAEPTLLGDDPKPRITLAIDAQARTLAVEDNGIGMSRDEMVEALGTIARSGTRAFVERLAGSKDGDGANLIGQFGVGFYSAFMVADQVEVISCRAGQKEAWRWASDGKGTFTVAPAPSESAPARGTRVILHLMEDAKSYTERFNIDRIVTAQSGHVPVPIAVVDKPGAEPAEIADGAALWTKPKSEIEASAYTDFYRGLAGTLDEPALTVHYRAEGRHEFTTLLFVPGSRPFDLFDPHRKGRVKLYVKRVFITDDAEILPRYLRFVRGLDAYGKMWDAFGSVLKEGIYEDHERREELLALARFRTTASPEPRRTLKDYVAAMKPNQDAIYYIVGEELARLEASPNLEGFRARGIEVLLLSDLVDSLWTSMWPRFGDKAFKSVTQGAPDLAKIPLLDAKETPSPAVSPAVTGFLAFVKAALGDAVSDVRASERLTDSAVCLVAGEGGVDRSLEKLLAGSGRPLSVTKPVLEINPRHSLVVALAELGDNETAFKADAAHLLFDEARVLDGDRPSDARAFSDRLARLIDRSLRKGEAAG
jgi:molecular chaperone HtpG